MHAIHPIRPVIGQANEESPPQNHHTCCHTNGYIPSLSYINPRIFFPSYRQIKTPPEHQTRWVVFIPARACSEIGVVATRALWFIATLKTVQQFCCRFVLVYTLHCAWEYGVGTKLFKKSSGTQYWGAKIFRSFCWAGLPPRKDGRITWRTTQNWVSILKVVPNWKITRLKCTLVYVASIHRDHLYKVHNQLYIFLFRTHIAHFCLSSS